MMLGTLIVGMDLGFILEPDLKTIGVLLSKVIFLTIKYLEVKDWVLGIGFSHKIPL